MMQAIRSWALVVVLTLALAGCSGSDAPTAEPADSHPSKTPAESPSVLAAEVTEDGHVVVPVASDVEDIDGLVEVNGHDLAVDCTGSGGPTAVILHGWVDEPDVKSVDFYFPVKAAMDGDMRVCSYDRANVGGSETVPGTQSPEQLVGDLDGLMEALGDPGPYVLVGQSFGGIVASAYAVAHPEKVAGIVMIDSGFADEIRIDHLAARDLQLCNPKNRHADGFESLQKVDNCRLYRWAYSRRDNEPDVPLIYLAAAWDKWSDYKELGSEWQKAIVPAQKAYAARWSPGRFEWVKSGHEIHIEQPDLVANAIREVAGLPQA